MRVVLLVAALVWGGLAAPRAQVVIQDHPGIYSQQDIDAGARVYNAQCAVCHGANGDMVPGIDLRRAQFRGPRSDDDLARIVTAGVPGAGMPPFALPPQDVAAVIAFVRAGFDTSAPVTVGSATRGRALVEGKGECLMCHRIRGRGPRVAPDLSDIGLARTPAALQRTLLDPSAAMLPINRPVRIVMKDGRTIAGRRLNEDTYTVQVIDAQERLLSIAKADVRTLTVETRSPMPAYATRFTPEELSDVLAYLLTLKEG
jgi:putative heme-binding domain-containing protein